MIYPSFVNLAWDVAVDRFMKVGEVFPVVRTMVLLIRWQIVTDSVILPQIAHPRYSATSRLRCTAPGLRCTAREKRGKTPQNLGNSISVQRNLQVVLYRPWVTLHHARKPSENPTKRWNLRLGAAQPPGCTVPREGYAAPREQNEGKTH